MIIRGDPGPVIIQSLAKPGRCGWYGCRHAYIVPATLGRSEFVDHRPIYSNRRTTNWAGPKVTLDPAQTHCYPTARNYFEANRPASAISLDDDQ